MVRRLIVTLGVLLGLALPASAPAAVEPWDAANKMPHVDPAHLVMEPATGFACGPVHAIGCTTGATGDLTIELYSGELQRDVYYHEEGHVFDFTVMTDPMRAAFERIWGLEWGWWQRFGSDGRSPGEWFAEGYRLCAKYGAFGRPAGDDYTSYGYPALQQWSKQQQVCALIISVGARAGLQVPAQAPATSSSRRWVVPPTQSLTAKHGAHWRRTHALMLRLSTRVG